MHRLADDVLAQHRPDRREAIAATGERGTPGTLQVQVAKAAIGADQFAEQQCPAIAEARDESAELMAGVGLCNGSGSAGDGRSDEEGQAVRAPKPGRVEAEIVGQRFVESEQPWIWSGGSLPSDGHLGQFAGEEVVEDDCRNRCNTHRSHSTERPGTPCGADG